MGIINYSMIMKFVAIADTHGRHNSVSIPSQINVDVIIFSGDFCKDKTDEECINFLDWLEGYPAKYKILVAGNHDIPFEVDSNKYIKICNKKKIIYLQDSSCKIEGIIFYGSPWTPIHKELHAFKKYAGSDEIKAIWNNIPTKTDVLITHGPPYLILDRLPNFNDNSFVNAGDKFLLKRVKEVSPKIHIFGHSHSDANKMMVQDNTMFINACMPDKINSNFTPTIRSISI